MAASQNRTQLLVIGAGPAGYPAAFRAADLGLDVTLVDPEANPGGVCLYRGCIPSKALLHVVSLVNETRKASRLGVRFSGLDLDLDSLRAWKDSVIKRLTGGLGNLCQRRKVHYVEGKARLTGGNSARIEPSQGGAYDLGFDHAIVATGSLPASIPPAIESERVMTSSEALSIADIPKTLLVVGAGYIGIELGQVYATLGSKVTLVEMLPEILPGADRDLVKPLSNRINEQFEDVLLGAKVVEMKEQKNGIKVRFEGENVEKPARLFDKVMLAVGRKPNTEGAGLAEAGVELDGRGFIKVDGQRRTTSERIFAAGDVAGEPMLAHKGTHEGVVAAEAASGAKSAYDPAAVPAVIFSDPEIAWAGLTETAAKEEGVEYELLKFPWGASGRAMTLNLEAGMTKLLVAPDSGRILGAGVAGRGAGELIAEATLAMEMGAVAEDLALTIHTHPTLGETFMEAAQMSGGFSTHYHSGRGKSKT